MNMANSVLREQSFNNLTINSSLNLEIDADLANKQIDTITASNYSGNGKINIRAISILADATEDSTEIMFTSSTVLKDKITTIRTANSALNSL